MQKILIDVPPIEPVLNRLRTFPGIEIVVADPISTSARALPPAVVRHADILFCAHPPTNHAEMKQLAWIQLWSSGFDHISGMNFPERHVRVTNARGVFDVAIGEWCVSMMINLGRDLRGMIRNQERGIWERATQFQRERSGG